MIPCLEINTNESRIFELSELVIHIDYFCWGIDGWMNQDYSRLSTTHGYITDCKLLVSMYWTRLVLHDVRPAACLYSASPLKHHPTGKQ